jgi:hypothetical protein
MKISVGILSPGCCLGKKKNGLDNGHIGWVICKSIVQFGVSLEVLPKDSVILRNLYYRNI